MTGAPKMTSLITVFSLGPFSTYLKMLMTCGPKILLHGGMHKLSITLLPISCFHDSHIFGTCPEGDSEDENHVPTMADTIWAKQAAQKAADRQQAREDWSLHFPPTFVLIFYLLC